MISDNFPNYNAIIRDYDLFEKYKKGKFDEYFDVLEFILGKISDNCKTKGLNEALNNAKEKFDNYIATKDEKFNEIKNLNKAQVNFENESNNLTAQKKQELINKTEEIGPYLQKIINIIENKIEKDKSINDTKPNTKIEGLENAITNYQLMS